MILEFWERPVDRDEDQQMLLQHAREYFPEGLDILMSFLTVPYLCMSSIMGDATQVEASMEQTMK